MFLKLKDRGQTTAEYAIVIALVIGAVVAMQVYVRRGLQGRVKDVVDYTDNDTSAAGGGPVLTGRQYEPYYSSSTATTTQTGQEATTMQDGGAIARGGTSNVAVTRTQTQDWTDYTDPQP